MSGQLLRFPTPEPEPAPTLNSGKVSLHDGELVLHQRGSVKGIWSYKLKLPDGSVERKTTGERDYAKAKKFAEDRMLEARWRGEQGFSANVVTFDAAAESYIKHLKREAQLDGRELDKHTEKRLGLVEQYLVPHFAGVALGAIDGKAVAEFHDAHLARWEAALDDVRVIKRRRRQKDGTIKLFDAKQPQRAVKRPGVNGRAFYDSMIKRIADHAVKQGMLSRAEVREFDATQREVKRRGGFSADEEARLLAHLEQRIASTARKHHRASRRNLWLWTRAMLLLGTRPGIETDIRFKDVTRVEHPKPHYLVKVRQGKTGPRTVLVDAAFGEVLDELRASHPDPTPEASLWTLPDGSNPISQRETLVFILGELGMDKDDEGRPRTAYSLRHTYASKAIIRGVNVTALAKNMGTSVEMIQRHYDHAHVTQLADQLLK